MFGELDLEINDLYDDDDERNENTNNGEETGSRNVLDEADRNNAESTTTTTTNAPTTTKRVVRNPQPKLNPERLCGERGIAQLPKIFSEFKVHGKGHEKEDLDQFMKTLEHWCHRLFPKLTFDDVLERIEKLGSKRAVQTCVKRIRLDMPLLSLDNMNGSDDEVDGASHRATDEASSTIIDGQLHATLFASTSMQQQSSSTQMNDASHLVKSPTLTKEQEERIERNRRLALERRAAQQQKNAQSKATTSTAEDYLSHQDKNVAALSNSHEGYLQNDHTQTDPLNTDESDNMLFGDTLLDIETETFLSSVAKDIQGEAK